MVPASCLPIAEGPASHLQEVWECHQVIPVPVHQLHQRLSQRGHLISAQPTAPQVCGQLGKGQVAVAGACRGITMEGGGPVAAGNKQGGGRGGAGRLML